MAFRIYTKTGDKGRTGLIGGTKVPKSHIRIESYGTVDELNSYIGLVGDQLAIYAPGRQSSPGVPGSSAGTQPGSSSAATATNPQDEFATVSSMLREIQDRLFTIGASLATDPGKESKMKIPDLKEEDVVLLEREMDRMEVVLPEMKSFLLPGGHVAVSNAHVARCVCRRAERICVQMQETGEYIEPIVLKYLNRLSDYLFMLARYAGHVLGAAEIPWRPRV